MQHPKVNQALFISSFLRNLNHSSDGCDRASSLYQILCSTERQPPNPVLKDSQLNSVTSPSLVFCSMKPSQSY